MKSWQTNVFLNISKAFSKVWRVSIIFKLKQNGISGNFLNLLSLSNFLRNRKQRGVLNGQASSWADVNSGVPQGTILGPLLFLIYINEYGLSTNAKLFADDTSLFSVVYNANTTAKELNNDLVKINRWAYQWKMSFNLDPSKQAQEVIFSRKTKKEYHLLSLLTTIMYRKLIHKNIKVLFSIIVYLLKTI